MSHFIYAIVGPSGAGKSTLADAVFKKEEQIVSFTSRDPRPGEKNGVEYYFIGKKTRQDIDRMKQECIDGKLVELVEYNGNVYGYSTAEILSKFNPKLKSAAAIVTREGYDNLKASQFGEYVIPVFVTASRDTIKRHLYNRNDTPENIEKRLTLYDEEAKNEEWFNQLNHQKILIRTDEDNLAKTSTYFKKQIQIFERA